MAMLVHRPPLIEVFSVIEVTMAVVAVPSCACIDLRARRLEVGTSSAGSQRAFPKYVAAPGRQRVWWVRT
jgi:hypothetical protein